MLDNSKHTDEIEHKRKCKSSFRFLATFNFKLVMLFCLLLLFIPICNATNVAEINPVNTPHGAVIFIVDGLSSSYVYPEYTPYAIDGGVLEKAEMENMQIIFDESCRVLDVTAPQTFTEGGHSVIATGYSKADSSIVGASGTSIYDVAHENGYMTFAIMQKGDSWGICKKQDVVIHDQENSVTEPEMVTEINGLSESKKTISLAVADFVQEQAFTIQDDLDQYPEGSLERYNAYNNWAIETGTTLIGFMDKEYPDRKYILTINIGAIDSAGHYKKDSGYIAGIEGIDNASMDLYNACIENDMAFILTSDHGMAFPTADSRGGHQADKYSVMDESQKVPLIIAARDVDTGVIEGEFGQEDIAPTILEVLNMPGELRASDGSAIPVKNYVNIEIDVPDSGELTLVAGDEIFYHDKVDDSILLMGLEPDLNYILKYSSGSDPGDEIERSFRLVSSMTISLAPQESVSTGSYYNTRYIVGGVMILLVNLTGLAMIRKVLKE